MVTRYRFGKTMSEPFDQAVEKITETLAKEGFGVFTEIDVAAKLKKKLGANIRPYRILGACNPSLAQRDRGRAARDQRVGGWRPRAARSRARSGVNDAASSGA